MPDFGTSNRVALRQVEETEWGETPASPALTPVRFTSESLNYNADFITSQEIRSDRMTPDTIQVASSASGDINGEWSYGAYDDFIAGAMYSDWSSAATAEAAQTDISLTKTAGTPSSWTLDSAALANFSNNGFQVGQFVRVEGFATAGTFYASITSISAASLGIAPLKDVASETAGDAVTVTPMQLLRNGLTKKSFTIQKSFTDLATPENWNFTGARISTWNLELATGSILTTTFGVMAKDAQMTSTQFAGAVVGEASTASVLNAVDNVAAITFDGDPSSARFYFSRLSLSLDNQLRGQEAVGTLGYIGVEAGRLAVTGSIELYFASSTLFDRFRSTTVFALSFQAQDSVGNVYIVTIPRAKYTSMEIVAGGQDQDIVASAEFEALINEAGTFQFQVSRLAAA